MTPRHRSALALAAPILLLSLAACSQEPAKPAAATPAPAAAPPAPPPAVRVYVTNEQSGDLTVINGDTQAVMATAPLGKRPRGIQASPDGKSLYVALSGSPPAGPGVDPKTLPPPDRNADGIGEVDADTYKLKRIIHAGADPEQLAVSADGTRLYVANEDTETLSVVDVASGKVVAAVKVGEEPEGVTIRPDGKVVYVTSEGDGAVFAIDTADQQTDQADPGRAAAAVDRVPARRLARLRLAGEPGRDRRVRRQGAEVPPADHARGSGQHAQAAADGHQGERRTDRPST